MSINTVILKENYLQLIESRQTPFELSDAETITYATTSSRQTLNVTQKAASKGVHINAADGFLFVTTKRFVYITRSQGDIATFSIDLSLTPSLQFSHELKSPWFGANYWHFMFYSTGTPAIASDGFPKNEWFEGDLSFNDGGLFQFVEVFNKVLNDAINNAHIDEQLPQYSEF